MRVLFDPRYELVTIEGNASNFTQIPMAEGHARALAHVLNWEFVFCKPGTTIPA